MLQATLLDQAPGQGRALPIRHHPSHDVAAEDVHDDVEVEVAPLPRPQQPCDIPGPDLARARRHQLGVDNLEADPVQIPAPEFIGQARRFVSVPTPADSTTVSQLSLTHLGEHRIRLYRVNQEYADLYEGRVQDSRDLNEPASNIVGGLGVFSAFASSEGTFTAQLTSP